MAKDVLKTISKLQKAYNYYGDIKGIYDKVSMVEKASKLKPSDIAGIKSLFGFGKHEKEIKKLIKIMDEQTALVRKAAKGSFEDIKTTKFDAWAKWAALGNKHGPDSKQALTARNTYLEALIKYDKDLHMRTTYCDLVVKYSQKAVKQYRALEKYAKDIEKLMQALIKMPVVIGTTHQAEALDMWMAFEPLAPAASRLHKAHSSLIKLAQIEKAAQMKIKKTNELWIKDLQKANMSKLLKDALKAIGFKLAA